MSRYIITKQVNEFTYYWGKEDRWEGLIDNAKIYGYNESIEQSRILNRQNLNVFVKTYRK